MTDKDYLETAFEQARESLKKGGFPAGAVVVKDGKIISKGLSLGYLLHDPTSHAETAAIREACRILQTSSLEGATLYESLEACNMCFSVANWAGISRIVSGSKKTQGMISKGYYEGNINAEDLNKANTRKVDFSYLPNFEKMSLELIKEWKKQNEF